jgi:hypothetical protein
VTGPIRSEPGRRGLTAGRAAGIACFFIKRGYHFVPVTRTGIAALYFLRPAAAPAS